MVRIAVDGMGGDFSPQEITKGLLIILSGKAGLIRSEIKTAHNLAEGSLIKKLVRELSDERYSG